MENNFPYMDIQNTLADHYEMGEKQMEYMENSFPYANVQNVLADYYESK